MVSFPLIRIYSSVTYPDMLPPHKVRLNKKFTTLRLTMIFKQPLNPAEDFSPTGLSIVTSTIISLSKTR